MICGICTRVLLIVNVWKIVHLNMAGKSINHNNYYINKVVLTGDSYYDRESQSLVNYFELNKIQILNLFLCSCKKTTYSNALLLRRLMSLGFMIGAR